MTADPVHLTFDGGTLVLTGGPDGVRLALPGVQRDPRTGTDRAEARHYRAILEHLVANKLPFRDDARQYPKDAAFALHSERVPRDYQTEAVHEWWSQRGRGLVVLPTGTGKTFVAMLAIARAGRPAMIVTPTIDLLNQWHYELSAAFKTEVGALGGGNHDIKPITVTTYDSAHRYVDYWGNKFGLLVFDECHHLPGQTYTYAAIGSIAPFRLGLSATPERADGGEAILPELIGPVVYRREIKELAGEFLAGYEARRVYVELTPEELAQYTAAREKFRGFAADRGISFGGKNGWQRFIWESSRTAEGRAAFKAYLESKRLERAASAKLATLADLLERHARERTLIFTADNATVYEIARRFLVPAITHQTKAKERKDILARFHAGDYTVIVTSQVLNEGVDVPSAGVGVVLSGTGSATENVQRLGRILRKHGDKQAILYEVVARDTAEQYASDRRRQHHAFR